MPLNNYQKNKIRSVRTDERTLGLKFWSLTTGASYFSPLDAYRKQTFTETSTLFSGAVYTNPYSLKQPSEGGFYKTSEIIIVASRDHRTVANSKDVKIEYDSIKFRVSKVIDCIDTEEIVIYASRLE